MAIRLRRYGETIVHAPPARRWTSPSSVHSGTSSRPASQTYTASAARSFPSHGGLACLTCRAGSERDDGCPVEQLLHEAPNRRECDPDAREGRCDLHREERGDDDLVRSRQDGLDAVPRRSVRRLSWAGRRDGH